MAPARVLTGSLLLDVLRELPGFLNFSLILGAELFRTDVDDDLLEGASELEWHLIGVVLTDRGAGILADVQRLIEGEAEGQRPFDAACRGFLSVHGQGSVAA